MQSIKNGADLRSLQPQMVLAAAVIDGAFTGAGLVDTKITSGSEQAPGRLKNSWHYRGRALDFRTNSIPRSKIDALVARIKERLGPQFDVVLKNKGEDNEHLHVEFDPKDLTPPSSPDPPVV